MHELVRARDPVFLSWIRARLTEEGIEFHVFDLHTSGIYGGALDHIASRVMVDEADLPRARMILDEGPGDPGPEKKTVDPLPQVDRILGGRVELLQPVSGYRAAIDPVFLAAAVPARTGQAVLDLGTGVGTAALCLGVRVPGLRLTGLELQRHLADLARHNAGLNGLGDTLNIVEGDVLNPPPGIATGPFDHVMANPPYQRAGGGNSPPDPSKAAANVESTATLADWIELALRALRHKGTFTMIHRADRLDAILAALQGRAGGIVVFPLWPGPDRESKAPGRVIVAARKGVKTPLRLQAGLVLHGADGAYTEAAEAVLRDGMHLEVAPRP